MDFDTEQFIYKIENRPALWNMHFEKVQCIVIAIDYKILRRFYSYFWFVEDEFSIYVLFYIIIV